MKLTKIVEGIITPQVKLWKCDPQGNIIGKVYI